MTVVRRCLFFCGISSNTTKKTMIPAKAMEMMEALHIQDTDLDSLNADLDALNVEATDFDALDVESQNLDASLSSMDIAMNDMEGSKEWMRVSPSDVNAMFSMSDTPGYKPTQHVDNGVWGEDWQFRRLTPFEIDTVFRRTLVDEPIEKTPPCTLGERHYHQRAFQRLVHPKSPITRAILDFGVGTGKTVCMLDAASAYWYDRRPILFLCPSRGTETNMYKQLLEYPTLIRDCRLHACLRIDLPKLMKAKRKKLGMSDDDWFNMFNTVSERVTEFGKPGCCSVNHVWSGSVVSALWDAATFKVKGKATKNAIVDTLALKHGSDYSLPGLTRQSPGGPVVQAPNSIVSVRNKLRSVWCGLAVSPLRVIGGTEEVPFPWSKAKYMPVIRSRPYPPVPTKEFTRSTKLDGVLDGTIVILDEAHKIEKTDRLYPALRSMDPDNSVLIMGTATATKDLLSMMNGASNRAYMLSMPDSRSIFPNLLPAQLHKVVMEPKVFAKVAKKIKQTAPYKNFVKHAQSSGALPRQAKPSKMSMDEVAAALFQDLISAEPSKQAVKCVTRMQELETTQTSHRRVKNFYVQNDEDAKLVQLSTLISSLPKDRFPVLVMARNSQGLCAAKKRLDIDMKDTRTVIYGRKDATTDCDGETDVEDVQSGIARHWRSRGEPHGSRVVLFANLSTMSEGVNMAGARTQIFISPPLKATIANQAAGRARRGCQYFDTDDTDSPIELHVLATVAEAAGCITGDEIAARVLQISEARDFAARAALRESMQAYDIDGSEPKKRYFQGMLPDDFCEVVPKEKMTSILAMDDNDDTPQVKLTYDDDFDADALLESRIAEANAWDEEDSAAMNAVLSDEGWLDWAQRMLGMRSELDAMADEDDDTYTMMMMGGADEDDDDPFQNVPDLVPTPDGATDLPMLTMADIAMDVALEA